MKHWLVLLATGVGATASGRCFAQASETDRSLAQSLFEQGKQLMDAGTGARRAPALLADAGPLPGGGKVSVSVAW